MTATATAPAIHRPVPGTARDRQRRMVVRCTCGATFAAPRPADLRDAYAQRASHIATA